MSANLIEGNMNYNGYFENLKSYHYNFFTGVEYSYLSKSPTKKGCLENAKRDGAKTILNNSNNRALIIFDGLNLFLQSYDTLILRIDTKTGDIEKLWDGYSVTTLKHINEFLKPFGFSFNKKAWLDFNGANTNTGELY